jgi:serine phosphatase RsbU (regulator of sigma subunit)
MEIQFAVAKINKYAVSESGDTIEVVERPHGGLSIAMADGQSSGRGAKAISMMVARKVISLLAEGVRDGAAARAASDKLYTERSGKVSCTLNILSVDMHSQTIVITRNNPSPLWIVRGKKIECVDSDSKPIGTTRHTRPNMIEIPIERGLSVICYTDGITHAGERKGSPLDVKATLRDLIDDADPTPQKIADRLLAHAIKLDDHRPADDISVIALKVSEREGDDVRRMSVRLPISVKEA